MGVRRVIEGSLYLSVVEEEEPGMLWEIWAICWEEAIVHTDFLGFFKDWTQVREKKELRVEKW